MTTLARLRYALFVTIVGTALVILVGSVLSADGIALVQPHVVDDLLNPLVLLVFYVVAWFVSPWLAQHVPITRGHGSDGVK